MMKVKLTIITCLIAFMSIAQTGINYKALVKDTNGNVIANQGIDMVFTIEFEGESAYSELQVIITDNNGIAIATIGEGVAISGDFDTIDWTHSNAELNVQIDFGSGLVDFGNTPFNAVPYALSTLNVEGLERVTENGNTGWRLSGIITDGDEGYGIIGHAATDLSVSDANGSSLTYPYGASGEGAFATGQNTVAYGDFANAMGQNSLAIGNHSNALGNTTIASGANAFSAGRQTSASGTNSTAMGVFSEASGEVAVAMGASVEATGNYATAFGRGTHAASVNSTAIGRYNLGFGDAMVWSDTSPLFEIGNGSSDTNRSNALTVYKSGFQVLASNSNGLFISTGNGSNHYGIEIEDSGGDALIITSAGNDGIVVNGATDDGLVINASDQGARISGNNAGLYANGGTVSDQADIPDIILGSVGPEGLNDDGIISTNPERISSDMFLRSYDAVVVQLDYDNNEAGNFRIRNGDDNVVFDVNESGNLEIDGFLRIGTETIEDGGSNALRFNASLLPDNNNVMSLGNSSLRWIGLWATDGTINTSDRREKKNIKAINYGLTEVLQMNPVSFKWKDRADQDTKLGLIAQDLLELVPEVVITHTWEKDESSGTLTKKELDRLGVYYSDLIPVLIKAIQEQQKIIDNQKSINAKQNSQLEALLSRIENLEANLSN